jgi:Spy/CpxP family protein refolding chaperone
MHPKMRFWWSHGHHPNCGPDHDHEDGDSWRGWRRRHRGRGRGGPRFGVRRPLRFLARHLDLDEKQTSALARIISTLKTERAQGEVDDRRALAKIADAVSGDSFDAAVAKEAGDIRREAAGRLADAVSTALEAMHEILDADQREELAYLIRTGGLRV